MSNHNTGLNTIDRQPEDTFFRAQMQRVFVAFYRYPKTMLEVSIETGIMRANICRYVAAWERSNSIGIVPKGVCSISKHHAGFYSTNPELFSAIIKSSNTVKL